MQGQGDRHAGRFADLVLPAREGEVAQPTDPQFANCGSVLSFRDKFSVVTVNDSITQDAVIMV